jgi:hypothetical protein
VERGGERASQAGTEAHRRESTFGWTTG